MWQPGYQVSRYHPTLSQPSNVVAYSIHTALEKAACGSTMRTFLHISYYFDGVYVEEDCVSRNDTFFALVLRIIQKRQ